MAILTWRRAKLIGYRAGRRPGVFSGWKARECPGDRWGPAAPWWQPLMRKVGHMPRYAIVEAPSALGHVPEHLGVERAPEVLLGAGLADGLAARRAGRVEAAGYSADRDSVTQVMNP